MYRWLLVILGILLGVAGAEKVLDSFLVPVGSPVEGK